MKRYSSFTQRNKIEIIGLEGTTRRFEKWFKDLGLSHKGVTSNTSTISYDKLSNQKFPGRRRSHNTKEKKTSQETKYIHNINPYSPTYIFIEI